MDNGKMETTASQTMCAFVLHLPYVSHGLFVAPGELAALDAFSELLSCPTLSHSQFAVTRAGAGFQSDVRQSPAWARAKGVSNMAPKSCQLNTGPLPQLSPVSAAFKRQSAKMHCV